ncbi:MAG TPA: hypothetical protein VFK06_11370, partial [Candidatus Angelobacter sp.]|nr:hypothetical protein [Candidatus Angelobacter sp.]
MADRNIAAEKEFSIQTEPSPSGDNPQDPGRRKFINQALAVSSGIALSGLIPRIEAMAQTVAPSDSATLQQELLNPGEIASGEDGILHAVVRLHAEDRLVSYLDVNIPNPLPPPGSS